MRDQLESYLDLLFAGALDAEEIKQEILQNTLDRYDDLVGQGKSPQAAYRLAISGIGDINEILGTQCTASGALPTASEQTGHHLKPIWKRVLSAIAICLYIMCPIPLFVLQNETGLCGLLTFVAIATALIIISGDKKTQQSNSPKESAEKPESEILKALNTIVWTLGLCIYFVLSFATGAWYITWIMFPLIGAVQGLIKACADLKEAKKHEI